MCHMLAPVRNALAFYSLVASLLLSGSCGQKGEPASEKPVGEAQSTSGVSNEEEDVSENLETSVGRALDNFVNTNKDLFKNSILLERSEEKYKQEVIKAVQEGAFNELTYNLLSFSKTFDFNTTKEFLEATFTVNVAVSYTHLTLPTSDLV